WSRVTTSSDFSLPRAGRPPPMRTAPGGGDLPGAVAWSRGNFPLVEGAAAGLAESGVAGIGHTGRGGALGAAPIRAPRGGDHLALEALHSVVVLGYAADDLGSRWCRSAGVGIAGRGRDDHAALGSALVGPAVLALHAGVVRTVVRNAADRLFGRRRSPRTGVRDARGAGRDGAALRGALFGCPVFTLHLRLPPVLLGDAAGDLVGVRVVRHRSGEDVLAGRVADHDRRAARIEAEQLIVVAARAGTETRPAAAAAGRRERADLHPVDDDVEGLIGIELLRDDIELPVLIGLQDELRATARVLIGVGRREGLLDPMARSRRYGYEPEGEDRDARYQWATGSVLPTCSH